MLFIVYRQCYPSCLPEPSWNCQDPALCVRRSNWFTKPAVSPDIAWEWLLLGARREWQKWRGKTRAVTAPRQAAATLQRSAGRCSVLAAVTVRLFALTVISLQAPARGSIRQKEGTKWKNRSWTSRPSPSMKITTVSGRPEAKVWKRRWYLR